MEWVVEMYFFPFVGGGHQIPMIDMARLFASHGAKASILTTPTNALSFQELIRRDQERGLRVAIHSLIPSTPVSNEDMSAAPSTDTSVLLEPFKQFLEANPPDCIVVDNFHRWAAGVIDELGVPRVTFNGNCCFSRCTHEVLMRYKPHEKVDSDYEPFVVPKLPDRIELTRSQLPHFIKNSNNEMRDRMKKSEEKSFGVLVNSFYELEPAYVEYFRKEMGNKAWIVGPVSLCNRDVEDKACRGKQASIDEDACLSWLECQKPDSVLYISYGSLARLSPQQVVEIAYGLDSLDHPFIWAVGKIMTSEEKEGKEDVAFSEFERRMAETKKGLIIKGWSPQLLILEHKATGGFMTHCGWNSTIEGMSAGVPMITWPLSAEQFHNEKLITDILKIGVRVGSLDWMSWSNMEPRSLIGREKVSETVGSLMSAGEEAEERRKRVKVLSEKAKRAVEVGGSSYRDADALIDELKCRKKNQLSGLKSEGMYSGNMTKNQI